MPIMPNMPIKPNMPIMPIMPTPKKTPMGATPPRAGAKRAQPPFTPMRDASPPFMLDERLYSSLQLSLPQPLAADSNSTPSWASAFEVLAVIEPSRRCCSMQSCITVPSGHIYVFFIVFLYIIMCYFTTTFWPFTMYTPFVRCFKSPLTRTPCRL